MGVVDNVLGVVGGVGGLAGAVALWQNGRLAKRSDSIQERLAAIEEARRSDEVAQQRREQADLVSYWLDTRLFEDPEIPEEYREPEVQDVIVIRNASDLPIHKVSVKDRTRLQLAVTFTFKGRIDTVPPHQSATKRWRPTKQVDPDPQPVVEFTDAQGVTWHRDEGGLHEGPSLSSSGG
jgi:hypothetical protein